LKGNKVKTGYFLTKSSKRPNISHRLAKTPNPTIISSKATSKEKLQHKRT